jgi:N6-L-threonylcarbamoyladenine synthase
MGVATAGPGLWAVSSLPYHGKTVPRPWQCSLSTILEHALPRLLAPCPFLSAAADFRAHQFQLVEGVGRYRRLGTTIDDALGEAFDKTAKLLGLGYPGGPLVEQYARKGNPQRFDFPRPLKGRKDCNFSFSGLKTAVRDAVHDLGPLSEQDIADVCASFETAVAETLQDRLKMAFAIFRLAYPEVKEPALIVAGGVAANATLKAVLATSVKSPVSSSWFLQRPSVLTMRR